MFWVDLKIIMQSSFFIPFKTMDEAKVFCAAAMLSPATEHYTVWLGESKVAQERKE